MITKIFFISKVLLHEYLQSVNLGNYNQEQILLQTTKNKILSKPIYLFLLFLSLLPDLQNKHQIEKTDYG